MFTDESLLGRNWMSCRFQRRLQGHLGFVVEIHTRGSCDPRLHTHSLTFVAPVKHQLVFPITDRSALCVG
jgi:hypothetical protein